MTIHDQYTDLPISRFEKSRLRHPDTGKNYRLNHKKENYQRSLAWKKLHPNYDNIMGKKYRDEIKAEIFVILGAKCANPYNIEHTAFEQNLNCIKVLQIDHVHGGGKKEIKRFNYCQHSYYKYILKQLKLGSKEYQLLCPTCNRIKVIVNKEK